MPCFSLEANLILVSTITPHVGTLSLLCPNAIDVNSIFVPVYFVIFLFVTIDRLHIESNLHQIKCEFYLLISLENLPLFSCA